MIIYKYELSLESKFSVIMRKNARIIKCEMQLNRPFIWAIVDENALEEVRNFQWIGTGEKYDLFTNRNHIATLQITDDLVGHLFEILKETK
jgi:hypothetical protein